MLGLHSAMVGGVLLLQGRRLHAEQFLQILGPLPTSGVLRHQASLVRMIQHGAYAFEGLVAVLTSGCKNTWTCRAWPDCQ